MHWHRETHISRKEPINYRGPERIWTLNLPSIFWLLSLIAASGPERLPHATEIASKKTIPMEWQVCSWPLTKHVKWTGGNSAPVLYQFRTAPWRWRYTFVRVNFDVLAQGNAYIYISTKEPINYRDLERICTLNLPFTFWLLSPSSQWSWTFASRHGDRSNKDDPNGVASLTDYTCGW